MTLNKLAVFAFVIGSLGSIGLVIPVQAADSIADKMKAWDPDKDGTLDLAEASKAAEARFDSLEKDNDGTLDKKEISSAKVDKKTFKKADPDNDGTLSKEEFLSIVKTRFEAADADHDGTVSAAELKTKAGKSLVKLLK
jgi:EF hand